MIHFNNRKKFTAPIIPAIILLIWLFYNSAYLVLINENMKSLAGYFALMGQVTLDFIIAISTFKHYKLTHKHALKLIYLLFFFSALSAAVADLVYHFAINVSTINYFYKVNSLFEVPFILFLLFQALAWYKLFFYDYEIKERKKFHSLPYLTVSLFIFFAFIYIIPWKIHFLSKLSLYQLIDTLLEVFSFALAAICLARSNHHAIRLLATGYLLIISSDLLIRYEVISGVIPFLSPFEASWNIGLLLMVLGFYYLDRNQIKLLPLDSLQSYMAIWLLNLVLIFALLFLSITYSFPDKTIPNYLLLVIIPSTLFAIICSKYFASKLLFPLERLELIIKEFLSKGDSIYSNQIKRRPSHINDFIVLEKFIYDAFELYRKNHFAEIEYAKMATQVAHDIKSPLLALNHYFKEAIQLDEKKFEVVESSLYRINEIANNLLTQYKKVETHSSNNNQVELIGFFLRSIVEEKKLQFKESLVKIKLSMDYSLEKVYVSFNAESFKRAVSNLINNAIESIENRGSVTISLKRRLGSVVLEIKDTGCGIPDEILKTIDQPGKTKKINGNGLGLSYALKSIKEWEATYKIDSNSTKGTAFKIIFPLQNPPQWIQEEIYIYDELTLIIVDDDDSIFTLWKEKINKNIKIDSLSCPDELIAYILGNPDRTNKLFLIDYHFNNSNLTGIDLIKKLCLNNAILVTNEYPDLALKSYIKENSIKYIFKKNVFLTSIFYIPKNPDLVLLDDKKIITDTWMIESKKHGKKIITFNNKEKLMEYIEFIDKSTAFYLDLHLEQENGIKIAKKLYEMGYKNLYITTGQNLEKIKKFPWIINIINKEPPFSQHLVKV